MTRPPSAAVHLMREIRYKLPLLGIDVSRGQNMKVWVRCRWCGHQWLMSAATMDAIRRGVYAAGCCFDPKKFDGEPPF